MAKVSKKSEKITAFVEYFSSWTNLTVFCPLRTGGQAPCAIPCTKNHYKNEPKNRTGGQAPCVLKFGPDGPVTQMGQSPRASLALTRLARGNSPPVSRRNR